MLALALVLLLTQWPLLSLASPPGVAPARGASHEDDEVCDPIADYFLGMEDYPEAIKRHLAVIRAHPDNALAHYHLGFAYGVTGSHQTELAEYQKAVDLGLSDWELFLNLGLLYVETGHLAAASEVLTLAALMAPYRPETHFNLGLVYERLGMLAKAEQETLLSLRLDPNQPEAHNMMGVIYAESGNYQRAHGEWSDLAATNPDYSPARANLVILGRMERGEMKGPRRLSGFAHAP
jgi:tetratricopeptide (TPR) repeat protein